MERHQDKTPLDSSLQTNLERILHDTGHSPDIVIRSLTIGKANKTAVAVLYTEGLVNRGQLASFVIEPISSGYQETEIEKTPQSSVLSKMKESLVKMGDIHDCCDFEQLYPALLSGRAIVLLDGFEKGVSIGINEWKDRGITENIGETVVRGPREAFTETLQTNVMQIRRKIVDPSLWIENRKIGRISQTTISIMYVNGLVDEGVLKELKKRLDQIDIDAILESGYIEEYIQDAWYSPFPTVYSTERPDVIAAGILEGRVAIFVDGTPFVLMVPSLFIEFYQAASDYYQRADISTIMRFLRLISFFIALLGPSFFIAMTTFHQEMIPGAILVGLVAQREGVPFPAFIEALLMEITFEILREAGIRMPRAVGNAVSVVGTLVIGTAAVEAGFVSAAMVIVVSITAISSFVVPADSMSISIRMLRFIFMMLAASFGLFGIMTGLILLLLHLCHLTSFGVPYFAPFGPFIWQDQKDALFRLPRWWVRTRPHLLSKQNQERTKKVQKETS